MAARWISWGKDGNTGKMYILQARPGNGKGARTVPGRWSATACRGAGQGRGDWSGHWSEDWPGQVRIVRRASEMDIVKEGDVLVADMTDP